MEASAFRGACAGRSAVGDTALSVLDERTYRRRRANHQDTVMTFHLAGADRLSRRAGPARPCRPARPVRALCQAKRGYGP